MFFVILQVQNLMSVHPDYGTRVQALLDKHNAEGKKVENIQSVSHTFIYVIL